MLLMNISLFDIFSRCIQRLKSYIFPEFTVMGCPSFISWSFVFLVLFSNFRPRGIMKTERFNMPSRGSIYFPLATIFSRILVMSLDQSFYLSSMSLTVIFLVSRSHPMMTLISSSRPSSHILLKSIKSGLLIGSLFFIGRDILWILGGMQNASLNQLDFSYRTTTILSSMNASTFPSGSVGTTMSSYFTDSRECCHLTEKFLRFYFLGVG